MKCLYCGKELIDPAEEEKRSQWHTSCTKKFFGTTQYPVLDLKDSTLMEVARKTVSEGYTVPGVQKKLSLHLIEEEKETRLTIVDYPTGFILKPQTKEFSHLPEFEQLGMRLAQIAKIDTVPFALVRLIDGSLAYITKRIDRTEKKKVVHKIAMEDFCQLQERLTEDKYNGSYERCAKTIKKYSSFFQFDLTELFIRLVFAFLIGNSDMHLKNFSLIQDRKGAYRLSPIYDQLPVNIVIPKDHDQTALTLNGKKRNLRQGDFLNFAEMIEIDRKTAKRLIKQLLGKVDLFLKACDESFLSKEEKEKVKKLIVERSQVFNLS